jgi:TrkA domain protein
MTAVNETRLPGLGVRHDFECLGGARLGVVSHHSGRREIVVYDTDDPDRVVSAVNLSAEESSVLVTLLGGATVVERFDDLRQQIAGLAIDWLPIGPRSQYAGRTLGETALRTRTGVSIVAIVRDETAIPAPGPDDVLMTGDTVVVVGTADGIDVAADLLAGGGIDT